MEEGAAAETDAKLKTFDDMTLRIAATAGAQVAYGHGAGESLKSVGPYAFCPPDVTLAAAAMGITYGIVNLENQLQCTNRQLLTASPQPQPPPTSPSPSTNTNPFPRLSVAQWPWLLPFHTADNGSRSHPPSLHFGARARVPYIGTIDCQRYHDAASPGPTYCKQ